MYMNGYICDRMCAFVCMHKRDNPVSPDRAEIPTNRRNKSADQFFSKTGSQCLPEEDECTQASTDSVAKDVAAPDTTRGPESTCSPESTDWGAGDEVLEEWRLKNTLGRAERTHKSQTAP